MSPAELKAQRAALGLSQARLAASLGVHPMTVSAWEWGKQAIPPYLALALAHLSCTAAISARPTNSV